MKFLFTSGKNALLLCGVHYVNDAIGAAVLNTELYSVDAVEDVDLGDIPEEAIIAQSLLEGKYVESGKFFADPTIFLNVSADADVRMGAIVLFKSADTFQDSTLIMYTDEVTDFPVEPDGESVVATWGSGSGEVFSL